MAETLDPALPDDITQLAEDLLRHACRAEITLATAESCTGGLLAALLTDLPGLSHVFDRGFVTYSKDAKCDLLDLDRVRLDSCGAVSRETAQDMARGALLHADADVVLAVTGFAGPGDGDDEEGLVHFACASRAGEMRHREEHFGAIGRQGVRIAALRVALSMMQELLHSLHRVSFRDTKDA